MREARGKAEDLARLRGFTGPSDQVTRVDDTVAILVYVGLDVVNLAVAVHIHAVAVLVQRTVALQGAAVGVVDLLVAVEGVHGHAEGVNLDGVAHAASNTSHLDTGRGRVLHQRKFGDLVAVARSVEANFKVGRCVVHQHEVHRSFDTVVGHRTYVGQNAVGEVGARRNGHNAQEVVGVLLVHVNATVDAALQEAVVHSDVGRSGLFPLQVVVVGVRAQDVHPVVAKLVLRGSCAVAVVGDVAVVVVDVLLTGQTVAQAHLQVAEERLAREDVFLQNVPSQCRRGEQTPARFLGET